MRGMIEIILSRTFGEMVNGKWLIENGKWLMGNRKLKMVKG
jgi:hypothetical protein